MWPFSLQWPDTSGHEVSCFQQFLLSTAAQQWSSVNTSQVKGEEREWEGYLTITPIKRPQMNKSQKADPPQKKWPFWFQNHFQKFQKVKKKLKKIPLISKNKKSPKIKSDPKFDQNKLRKYNDNKKSVNKS